MSNEKFNQDIDEIVGFITEVHKLQMDQLKCNIRAVHEANANEIDPNEIAQQIMNLPVEIDTEPTHKIEPARPAIHLRDEMVCTAEKQPALNEAGDLKALSFVKVGNAEKYSKEFYHHCPDVHNHLIRLHYIKEDDVHACPVCRLIFR